MHFCSSNISKKGPLGPFLGEADLLFQPPFDDGGAVFSFPLFQSLVVAAFGFDNLTSLRIFVDLERARFTSACFLGGSMTTDLWIEQVDDVLQAVPVLSKQFTELGFELNFFLQAVITFQCFQNLKLFGQVFFQLTIFCEFGHWYFRIS
jgi:hypothetical protein